MSRRCRESFYKDKLSSRVFFQGEGFISTSDLNNSRQQRALWAIETNFLSFAMQMQIAINSNGFFHADCSWIAEANLSGRKIDAKLLAESFPIGEKNLFAFKFQLSLFLPPLNSAVRIFRSNESCCVRFLHFLFLVLNISRCNWVASGEKRLNTKNSTTYELFQGDVRWVTFDQSSLTCFVNSERSSSSKLERLRKILQRNCEKFHSRRLQKRI